MANRNLEFILSELLEAGPIGIMSADIRLRLMIKNGKVPVGSTRIPRRRRGFYAAYTCQQGTYSGVQFGAKAGYYKIFKESAGRNRLQITPKGIARLAKFN